jgi:predicted esterase
MAVSAASSSGFRHVFEQGTDAGAPTLLLLHGTGGDEHDLLPLARTIAPGASLLSARGKVLENGAPRYFRRIAEGVFDQTDLAFRTTELHDFVKTAAKDYSIDLSRLLAVGFSNGANIAGSLLLRHPETLAGALLLRAMVPFKPPKPLNLQRRPILLLAGIADPIVSATESQTLEELFEQANARVELQWVDAGHALSAEDVEVSRRWLQQFYR